MKDEPRSQTQLVLDRAGSGDQNALGELLTRFTPRLLALIRKQADDRLRDEDTVLEILAEVYLRVVQGFPRFENRGPGSFLGWLKKIAVNSVIDRGRQLHSRRGQDVQTSFQSAHADIWRHATGALTRMQRLENSTRLFGVLERLPEDEREILLLHKLEGWTLQEMAEVFGVRESTLHDRIKKAKLSFARVWRKVSEESTVDLARSGGRS